MPNWCQNVVEISHTDRSKMDALVDAINEGKFCNFAIPVPESLHITAGREGSDDDPKQIELERRSAENIEKHGYANWYDFCVNRWGTKWDVEPPDTVEKGDGISFSFDSAWAPPLGVYEALVDQGFDVKAYYWECGMCFAGVWDNGDDDYFDYTDMSSKEVRDQINEELDYVFGISDNIEEWEEENKDEVQEWYEDGVEKRGLDPHTS